MKSLSKFALILGLSLLGFNLSSCGGKGGQVSVNGDDDGGGGNKPNKPSPAVPPQFDTNQFKVGNYIEWAKTNSNGSNACVKWTISKVWTTQAQIKRHESTDCKNYSDEFFELIDFRFEDGLVLNHDYVVRGVTKPAPQDVSLFEKRFKLFDHFYKNPTKVLFTIGTDLLGGKIKYPIFKLTEGDRIYYKGDTIEPIHPWHAVILKFKDTSQPPNFYVYKSANPALIGAKDKD